MNRIIYVSLILTIIAFLIVIGIEHQNEQRERHKQEAMTGMLTDYLGTPRGYDVFPSTAAADSGSTRSASTDIDLTKNSFASILADPTPMPTPEPTPPPEPDLSEVLKRFELTGVLSSLALIYNKRNKQDFQIKVGDSFTAIERGVQMNIELIEIDIKNLAATFQWRNQTHTMSFNF